MAMPSYFYPSINMRYRLLYSRNAVAGLTHHVSNTPTVQRAVFCTKSWQLITGIQSSLDSRRRVAARLDDGNQYMRNAAIETIRGRRTLPNAVLMAVSARLDDRDRDVQSAAIEILGEAELLPDEVLMAVVARLDHIFGLAAGEGDGLHPTSSEKLPLPGA